MTTEEKYMKVFKLVLSFVALGFFVAAAFMFFASFIDSQAVALVKTEFAQFLTGFEIIKNENEIFKDGKNIWTLVAFILVVIGALASLYGVFFAFTHGEKKSKKGNNNAKLICACCTFLLCGVAPAILLFLTLKTLGISADSTFKGLLGANFRLGIGAILAAIFSLVGSCSLCVAELK